MAENQQIAGGSYEIIRKRLLAQSEELRTRLSKLNVLRKDVFGALETRLLANDRITTSNNCIPRDMVPVDHHFIFGYNVHIGLRQEVQLDDVFSMYRFDPSDHSFHQEGIEMLEDKQFVEDFHNLYKYYKNTVFTKFAVIGPHLYMVFQVGKNVTDIKTFKWAIKEKEVIYLGNRFDHEFKYPAQHEFRWQRTNRDMHRRGSSPHISILDRVFVENLNKTLTLKVEDNTDHGKGIYEEALEHGDQNLDDAEFYFADLGKLILLKVKPYQEEAYRYLVFNEKLQQVTRIDTLADAGILLPDGHGLIFSNGYYLERGDYKVFDNKLQDMHFEKRIPSPNGEDTLFVFYNQESGTYVLMPYNLVEQQVATPIICNGYSIFPNGELCYFKAEDTPGKHHVVQVWQTPYTTSEFVKSARSDSYLYKVGNKDLVRGMAESNELLAIIQKGESYNDLYIDLVKQANDILDSYYWIKHPDTQKLHEPLEGIRDAAASAIDEYEKVRRMRAHTQSEMKRVGEAVDMLFEKIRRYKAQAVDKFVAYLAELRHLRGEAIELKELRYVDLEWIESKEKEIIEKTDSLSQDCVKFLLKKDALQPYEQKVADDKSQVSSFKTVAEGDKIGQNIDQTAKELELLIQTVSNLKIEDATQTTQIIDRISAVYTQLNQLRALLKKRRKELLSTEAVAEFNAQLKLLNQGVINYLDLCDTPEKTEEYLTKLMVQVEELEGKFSEFDDFIGELAGKREEIYNAFETRKLGLLETRNKRAAALQAAAERILKGIQNRTRQFEEIADLNAYLAGDLMVEKVRDIIAQLRQLNDSVKAGDLEARIKSVREDAVRQLKDRKELFVGGENVIKMGRHNFSVNIQELDLTIVPKEDDMYFHLTGTNFFEKIQNEAFDKTRPVWNQSLVSENSDVYRAEYLAFQILQHLRKPESISLEEFQTYTDGQVLVYVQDFMAPRYHEGYVKGVHDQDAAKILQALSGLAAEIDLLRYAPEARALAATWWHGFIGETEKNLLLHRLKGAGVVLQLFPNSQEFGDLLEDIQAMMEAFRVSGFAFREELVPVAAEYLFYELALGDHFVISGQAADLYQAFLAYLKKKKFSQKFKDSIAKIEEAPEQRYELTLTWVKAFLKETRNPELETRNPELETRNSYATEVASMLFADRFDEKHIVRAELVVPIEGLIGEHRLIGNGTYVLDYLAFMQKMQRFVDLTLPAYEGFVALKKTLTEQYRKELRLEEFKPRVLTSFVRNKLIDELYLPLIGDNLAKQIGTVGENTRTDRMGMLLLISPPGYGKTTLMEYIANRLGLIFMKINGPALGHHVTSLDPVEAPNAAAREELKKLNLALEMGDNVMLYLDDIQHCHTEFLQKFISLADGTRKIEGVYKGHTRTYDLRGKKVCVVMAGNPYTETGEKFQIPDMLANRADTYNLGDIIGDSAEAFKLSYLENSLTSNQVLNHLATHPRKDIYNLIHIARTGEREGMEFESNFSADELQEYVSVLKKLLLIQEIILEVNQQYIASAGQEDAYRTEPSFQLQGSYRNMNKLAEKVQPIMNDQELKTLILSHYENESQTLTTGAEANLLKFKELTGWASKGDAGRWADIKATFMRNKLLQGDRLGQLVQQMGAFAEGLEGIRKALGGKEEE